MTFKEFWNKFGKIIASIVGAVLAFFVGLTKIRECKANKQVECNQEQITKIEVEKEKINETIKKSESLIASVKDESIKASAAICNSETVINKIDDQISKNESILEKYKK